MLTTRSLLLVVIVRHIQQSTGPEGNVDRHGDEEWDRVEYVECPFGCSD
jgi:hypothetical protein